MITLTVAEAARARLLEAVDRERLPEWLMRLASPSVRRVIESEILPCPWMQRCGEISVPHRRYRTRTEAAKAAGLALGDLVRSRSWAVLWGAATDRRRNYAFDTAWDAARHMATDTVWEFVWGTDKRKSDWESAWAVVRDAATDAALHCVLATVCSDLPVPDNERRAIEGRWSIWRAGYGCVGDEDGTFFVFERV